MINYAGLQSDQLSLNIGEKITNRKRETFQHTHMKYIDDLSLAVAINLKEILVVGPNLPRPLSYHERTSHTLPHDKNVMQQHFTRLMSHAKTHKMVINEEKSKVMLFNKGRKFDFLPCIKTEDGNVQGVIFPAGVRVFPAGNLQHLTGNFSPNLRVFVAFESSGQ